MPILLISMHSGRNSQRGSLVRLYEQKTHSNRCLPKENSLKNRGLHDRNQNSQHHTQQSHQMPQSRLIPIQNNLIGQQRRQSNQYSHGNNGNNFQMTHIPIQNNFIEHKKNCQEQNFVIPSNHPLPIQSNLDQGQQNCSSNQAEHDQNFLRLFEIFKDYYRLQMEKRKKSEQLSQRKIKETQQAIPDFIPNPYLDSIDFQNQLPKQPKLVIVVKKKDQKSFKPKPMNHSENQYCLKNQGDEFTGIYHEVSSTIKGQYISKFPKQQTIFYQVELYYKQLPKKKLSKILSGSAMVIGEEQKEPPAQMINQAVKLDLYQTHSIILKKPMFIFLFPECEYRRPTLIEYSFELFSKYWKRKDDADRKRYRYQGMKYNFEIEDQLIQLPQGYRLIAPSDLQGFHIKLSQLCIGNQYGQMKWTSQNHSIDFRKVNFKNGITIDKESFQIDCPDLEKGEIIIQFYSLPQKIATWIEKGSEWVETKLKKNVKKNRNLEFVSYEAVSHHWKIKSSFIQ